MGAEATLRAGSGATAPRTLRRALLLLWIAAGCSSTASQTRDDGLLAGPEPRYVGLGRLAADLNLHYRDDVAGGYLELSAPPDNLVFVPDSSQCLVNGRSLSMEQPCLRRGEGFVLSAGDAERVTRALRDGRPVRRAAPPSPPDAADRPARASPPSGLPMAWRPDAPPRAWKYIVIHHMASGRGSAAAIHRIHMGKGWDGLGYHFVVGNGTLTGDGEIEIGYRWKRQTEGAHARVRPDDDNWWNENSIGVCLVGDFTVQNPTPRQLEATARLVRTLQAEFAIPTSRVIPHEKVKDTLCPGPRFPWNYFIARLR